MRKRIALVMTAVILAVSLAACGASSEPESSPAQDSAAAESADAAEEPTSLDVTFDVTYIRLDSQTRFNVETNLPNFTKLSFMLSGDDYIAQCSGMVYEGRVTTDGFTKDGMAIPPGTYTFDITMVLPSLQPDSVQKAIGTKGELLSGEYVTRGGGGSAYTVSASFDFEL